MFLALDNYKHINVMVVGDFDVEIRLEMIAAFE